MEKQEELEHPDRPLGHSGVKALTLYVFQGRVIYAVVQGDL